MQREEQGGESDRANTTTGTHESHLSEASYRIPVGARQICSRFSCLMLRMIQYQMLKRHRDMDRRKAFSRPLGGVLTRRRLLVLCPPAGCRRPARSAG